MKSFKVDEDQRNPVLVSDFSDVELPPLREVPGMTSASEGRYLYWLASSQLSGEGELVEIGSWLGRSTMHLAAGLRRTGSQENLHCFDGFAWGPSDPQKSDLPLRPGDNFQAYFEANLADYSDLVSAHRTRIANIAWTGQPVEVLFLDAPKKLTEITRCLEVFGPSLIPGRSIIAIQDYQYFPAYALAACMYSLRDCLELIHVVLDGSTVAFRVTAPVDLVSEKPSDWQLNRWTVEQVNSAWQQILAPLPEKARERLEPGRALHLYDCGAKREAIAAMKALPMTPFQQDKIGGLARGHIYLSYPELFTAAGFPGSPKQNLLVHVKRARDWLRELRA